MHARINITHFNRYYNTFHVYKIKKDKRMKVPVYIYYHVLLYKGNPPTPLSAVPHDLPACYLKT